jgi:hypothetical protein
MSHHDQLIMPSAVTVSQMSFDSAAYTMDPWAGATSPAQHPVYPVPDPDINALDTFTLPSSRTTEQLDMAASFEQSLSSGHTGFAERDASLNGHNLQASLAAQNVAADFANLAAQAPTHGNTSSHRSSPHSNQVSTLEVAMGPEIQIHDASPDHSAMEVPIPDPLPDGQVTGEQADTDLVHEAIIQTDMLSNIPPLQVVPPSPVQSPMPSQIPSCMPSPMPSAQYVDDNDITSPASPSIALLEENLVRIRASADEADANALAQQLRNSAEDGDLTHTSISSVSYQHETGALVSENRETVSEHVTPFETLVDEMTTVTSQELGSAGELNISVEAGAARADLSHAEGLRIDFGCESELTPHPDEAQSYQDAVGEQVFISENVLSEPSDTTSTSIPAAVVETQHNHIEEHVSTVSAQHDVLTADPPIAAVATASDLPEHTETVMLNDALDVVDEDEAANRA